MKDPQPQTPKKPKLPTDEEEAADARARYKPLQPSRKYQAKDLIIPPSDRKGHSAPVHTKVPPWLAQEAQAIYESKKFPFRVVGDITRLGLYMVVEYLRKMEPTKPSWMTQVDLMNEMVRHDMMRQEIDQMFDFASGRLRELTEQGDDKARAGLIARLREAIETHAKGEWRKKLEQRFEKEFGKYIGG